MTATDQTIDTAEILSRYQRSFEQFEGVLAAVADDAWDRTSKCDAWSIADVVGHVIWGQQLIWSLATDAPFESRDGAPGAPNPRAVIGNGNPDDQFRKARDAALEALTPAALTRVVHIGAAFGTAPLARFATALSVVDAQTHAWDIAAAAGVPLELPDDLVAAGDEVARAINLTRNTPGGIKSALEAPPGSDAQTRFLAYLGRQAW